MARLSILGAAILVAAVATGVQAVKDDPESVTSLTDLHIPDDSVRAVRPAPTTSVPAVAVAEHPSWPS